MEDPNLIVNSNKKKRMPEEYFIDSKNYLSFFTTKANLTTALYSTILLFSTFAVHFLTWTLFMFSIVLAASFRALSVASLQPTGDEPTNSIIFTTDTRFHQYSNTGYTLELFGANEKN